MLVSGMVSVLSEQRTVHQDTDKQSQTSHTLTSVPLKLKQSRRLNGKNGYSNNTHLYTKTVRYDITYIDKRAEEAKREAKAEAKAKAQW